MAERRYYVTTPIYYVNDSPHIGHAYTTLACDVLARFKRLDGYDVMFLTGTDEHGQKVEKSAIAAGMTPKAFTDKVSQNFRDLAKAMNFSNDDFIRTTEQRHIRACQAIWQRLVERGEIYLDKYAGWYAVRDEAYYAEDELTTGPDGKKIAPSGAEVEWVEEPSYFFRLGGLAGAAARILRRPSGFHRAREPAQRGDQLRARRLEGSLGLAHQLQMGRAGAGRSRPYHVCLARRAHQLHHRHRLSRYGERQLQALLAGRSAYGGQGYPALPRRLLAGLPDGGRSAGAAPGLRPWLVDQ